MRLGRLARGAEGRWEHRRTAAARRESVPGPRARVLAHL